MPLYLFLGGAAGSSAILGALADVTGRPRLTRVSALFGGPMATYTAVLLANTAVPSWHEPHEELPFVFADSAMAAGGGLTMMFTPVDEAGSSRRMGVAGRDRAEKGGPLAGVGIMSPNAGVSSPEPPLRRLLTRAAVVLAHVRRTGRFSTVTVGPQRLHSWRSPP